MEKIKSGDIIFLTVRKKKPFYRLFISRMIALLTRRRGQALRDVKVHSSIIYYDNDYMVREMGKHGDEHYSLTEYWDIFGDRAVVKSNPNFSDRIHLAKFNSSCKNTHVKYDYKNTFWWQLLYIRFRLYFGGNTYWERMCSEDVQREYNNLVDGFFSNPERISPNKLFKFVQNWTEYRLN